MPEIPLQGLHSFSQRCGVCENEPALERRSTLTATRHFLSTKIDQFSVKEVEEGSERVWIQRNKYLSSQILGEKYFQAITIVKETSAQPFGRSWNFLPQPQISKHIELGLRTALIRGTQYILCFKLEHVKINLLIDCKRKIETSRKWGYFLPENHWLV